MMLHKRAYLIERSLTKSEEEGFLSLLQQQQAAVYLSVPNEILSAAGAALLPELTPQQKVVVNEQLLRSLNELGHSKAGKDTVAAQLTFDGFPSWYYHKFRIVHILQPVLYRLEQYKKLLQESEQLIVYNQTPLPPHLAQSLPLVLFVPAALPAQKEKGFKNMLPSLRKMGVRFMAGARQALLRKEAYPRHLFVLNQAHVRPILDPDQLPALYQDHVFVGYFLKEWSEHFLLIDKRLIDKNENKTDPAEDQKGAYWQRPLLFSDWIEDKALLNPLLLLRLRSFHKYLKKKYRQLAKHIQEPVQKQLFREMEKLHASSLYFFFVYQAYRAFFREHQFESVTLLDEYSPNFRAIIDAAKKEGVRSQAIQHGALAATNPGYSYTREDARFNPWPERTLVWGDYWKELLIEVASYPAESLRVTGQIRTDVVPRLLEMPLEAAQVLGLEASGKFLILFATQPQPDENLRQRAALDVFSVAAKMPDAWVVVKPHPREKDIRYYEALAREAGCSNYSIHYEAELFLLLRVCQVLVHCYSTVGVEAVYFGMPAIILDYLQLDLLRFAAEGVALQAISRDELQIHLEAIQQKTYQLDSKKKQAYIKKYACAVDGKVSERTASALLDADG